MFAVHTESLSVRGVPIIRHGLAPDGSGFLSVGICAARTVSHALLTLGSAYVFVYLPVQIEQKPTAGTTLLFLFLSVLVYAIGAAILAAVAHRRDSRAVNEQPYRSQFGKRDQ